MKSYKDLLVWQKSIELTEVIYSYTKKFPKDEIYGLVSQMRRSSVSIPSNIAEGYVRNTQKEFLNFLYIAKGSATELETQILISSKVLSIDEELKRKADQKIEEVLKMLSVLIKRVKEKI